MASLAQTGVNPESVDMPEERVLSAEQEKAKKKLLKHQAHELRMLEQRKKKDAKKIKDKAKRMEHYKRCDVMEAEMKERHAEALEQLLSSKVSDAPHTAEAGNSQEIPNVEEQQETAEEAKIRKKKEKAARKRQAKLEKEKAFYDEIQKEREKERRKSEFENWMMQKKATTKGKDDQLHEDSSDTKLPKIDKIWSLEHQL